MDKYKPQIAKPCHEDWNTILPNDNGRYCQVCEKTVVDFTKMSLEEIKSYLQTNLDQQVCGRMKDAINADIPHIHQQLIRAHETIQTKWTKTIFRGTALFFIG